MGYGSEVGIATGKEPCGTVVPYAKGKKDGAVSYTRCCWQQLEGSDAISQKEKRRLERIQMTMALVLGAD